MSTPTPAEQVHAACSPNDHDATDHYYDEASGTWKLDVEESPEGDWRDEDEDLNNPWRDR